MGVDHKLLLQIFLIGFCLFCSNNRKGLEISFNFRYDLDDQRNFHALPGNPQQILAYS